MKRILFLAAGASALFGGALRAQADLGTARSFAVLGASTVTSTGTSVVTGSLGVSPGSAIVGFPPGVVVGSTHVTDAVATQARSDAAGAFGALAALALDTDLTGQDLGGLTLVPGVYFYASSAFLNGPLTLDASGDPAAVFVFQIGTTLISGTASSVSVINGGSACNVFWQVGSSATIGSFSSFAGVVIASDSVTLNDEAEVLGRVVALTGAVTMISNVVTIPIECRCLHAASTVDLGPGCGAPAPLLSGTPPIVGLDATLSLNGVFPNAMVTVFISACGATPFNFPPTACPVYLDVGSMQVFATGTTDGAGNWSLTFGIPLDDALLGQCFAVQALVWTGTGPLAGDFVTNGLAVTIGCQ
jgi:hypothetical protein